MIWLGLLSTWSRSPCLAAAIGSCVVVCRFRGGSPRARAMVLCLLMSVTVLCFWQRGTDPTRRLSSARSAFSRIHLWQTSVRVLAENPFGVGPTDVVLPVAATIRGHRAVTIAATDPKNQLIMLLDAFGWLGGLLGTFYLVAIARSFKYLSLPDNIGLAGVCATLGIACLVDTPFLVGGRESSMAVLGLLSGMILRLSDVQSSRKSEPEDECSRTSSDSTRTRCLVRD